MSCPWMRAACIRGRVLGRTAVDFDDGRGLVDVDAADERELVEVSCGDGVDGQGRGVQGVRDRAEAGGEDFRAARGAVMAVR